MTVSFDKQFLSLPGFSPMKWQCRLFKRFIDAGLRDAHDIASVCYILSGLGKTSIMVSVRWFARPA